MNSFYQMAYRLNTDSFDIKPSISLTFLGKAPDKFVAGPLAFINISSSILTPIFHHFLSHGEPSGI